jgi:hypothetical protein
LRDITGISITAYDSSAIGELVEVVSGGGYAVFGPLYADEGGEGVGEVGDVGLVAALTDARVAQNGLWEQWLVVYVAVVVEWTALLTSLQLLVWVLPRPPQRMGQVPFSALHHCSRVLKGTELGSTLSSPDGEVEKFWAVTRQLKAAVDATRRDRESMVVDRVRWVWWLWCGRMY